MISGFSLIWNTKEKKEEDAQRAAEEKRKAEEESARAEKERLDAEDALQKKNLTKS